LTDGAGAENIGSAWRKLKLAKMAAKMWLAKAAASMKIFYSSMSA